MQNSGTITRNILYTSEATTIEELYSLYISLKRPILVTTNDNSLGIIPAYSVGVILSFSKNGDTYTLKAFFMPNGANLSLYLMAVHAVSASTLLSNLNIGRISA